MLLQLYISFVRRRQKNFFYKSWDKYLWVDYLSRSRLAKTFIRRHTPLSRGVKGTFGTLLTDPASWDAVDNTTASQKKGSVKDVKSRTVNSSMAAAAGRIVEDWDSDEEKWVPRT